MLFSTRIIGRVAKDAELKDAGSHKVCKFSVATNPTFGKDKKTVWVNVTTWDKKAEIDAQYVKKGMMVYCEGTLQSDDNGKPRTYTQGGETKVSGFEMTANTVLFLSKPTSDSVDTTPLTLDNLGDLGLTEEEIPF